MAIAELKTVLHAQRVDLLVLETMIQHDLSTTQSGKRRYLLLTVSAAA